MVNEYNPSSLSTMATAMTKATASIERVTTMRRMKSIAKRLLNRSYLARKPAYGKKKQGYYLRILVPSIDAS